jgi:DNA-binding NtrC family response regulator
VLAKLERSLIERAIDSSDGVWAEAARQLGLSRSDFGYELQVDQVLDEQQGSRVIGPSHSGFSNPMFTAQ